jgi:hypothetical protein
VANDDSLSVKSAVGRHRATATMTIVVQDVTGTMTTTTMTTKAIEISSKPPFDLSR